jgi:hypothetical protein
VKIRPYEDLEYDDGEPFTYGMWVYNEGTTTGHLFGKRHLCGSGASFDYQLVVEYGTTDLTSHLCDIRVSWVPTRDWQYIVASYDGVAFNLYADGALIGEGEPCGANTLPTLGGELRIGSSGTCGTSNHQGWIGLIDDVMLWDRTLTANEIACAAHGELHE